MKDNVIEVKSYEFAKKIIKYIYSLDKNFYNPIYKQLLRCGTSIGANVQEAIGGQSNADFYHKLGIAQKEARESIYRISLLIDCKIGNEKALSILLADSKEILKIISSILLTLKYKKTNS